MLMRHPAVHSGFLKAWHANGLSQKVLGRVKELVESRDEPCAGIRLMVTGVPGLEPILHEKARRAFEAMRCHSICLCCQWMDQFCPHSSAINANLGLI